MKFLYKLFLVIFLNFKIIIRNIYAIPLSIVVPVYNTEPFLDRCINSILNQTFNDYELIFIDDASSDNSLTILNKYQKNDNRIKIIHFEINKGASVARNAGIEVAEGKYIGFVDSDDYIDEKFYEKLIKNTEDFDIVIGHYVYSTNLSKHYIIGTPRKHWSIYDAIWKKEFLNKNKIRFNEKMRRGNDEEFNNSAFKYKPNVKQLPDDGIYYYYKRRIGSLRNFSKKQLKLFNKKAREFIRHKKRIYKNKK